jgi:hypothetical protein
VRAPSQRRALGALFFVLTALFAGIAVAGARADVQVGWVVALAAGVLALWMLSLVLRAWRR